MPDIKRYKLDLQLFGGDKTEKATPKKRQDARKKGQIAKSPEVSGAVVLLAAVLSLTIFGGFMKKHVLTLFLDVFQNRMEMDVTAENVARMFNEYGLQILILLAPLLGITFVLALIANYAQVGFMATGEGITPKFSKINPIKGFKNIFSMRSFVEFLKSIFKLVIITYLVYSTLWGEKESFASLSRIDAEGTFNFAAKLTMNLGIKIGVALFIMAVFDYMYQKYEHEKSLRMSKQDIKDEYKKMEGDPIIKGKIRERQRRMAMQRMMQEVPKADVIITNPTHFAVALKYDGSKMEAPEIVAKGQDYVALRIREMAKEHGVMTIENKPLARALFQRAEIGDVVPQDLFQAVAEVLAYVYKLKGKRR
ncbi:flagellar biosynthesis protein FlhB [Paenibacillus sp. FSL R7-0273]|uniref:flagellar biosynthesis protein FlhB n=1 Tax=Paenibacillus sp. FSL R7-0273 TaxID=1536772 RepID=UPI0004F5A5F3|nr:flagellar biosynthesis protein FlhB [Paenibacillus sp. FSL R7-0273]AIQ47847.1 flagellar biosynthesis protein FlhB [Paenibacillus sp. FSL R7-0273]OMF94598.1 flagellar biosynthesis protein FlhB [Paenibacillus sp. FSL R7-0273]